MRRKNNDEKIILHKRRLERVIEELISRKVHISVKKLEEYLKRYDPQNIQKFLTAERSIYNIIYLIAMVIVKEGAVAYWSALYHHNLSDRLSKVIYIHTTKKRGYTHREYVDGEIVVRVYDFYVKPVVIKREKYFGVLHYIDNDTGIEYAVTDREKTVVDCVDKPKYCGGFSELIPGIAYSKLDYQKIIEYAERMKNYTVIKRLGYISERLGWGVEDELRKLLSDRAMRTYSTVDPTEMGAGIRNKRWKLMINVPEDIWEVELG